MNKSTIFTTLSLVTFSFANAQSKYSNLFYNNGSVVTVQGNALLHVQGDVVNQNGSDFVNNGVLQVEGDFTNQSATAKFRIDNAGTGVATKEQTVRFIGGSAVAGVASSANYEQRITGNMAATDAYFQNVVIDKEFINSTTPSYISLNTDAVCKGSLVWGASTPNAALTNGFNPSWIQSSERLGAVTGRTQPNRTGDGVLRTHDGAGNDYEFYVTNGNFDAITGYQTPVSTSSATAKNKYVELRGNGTVAKGFARERLTDNKTYTFPIGTNAHTYNPVDMYFTGGGSASNKIIGKFTDDASHQVAFTKQLDCANSSGFPASAVCNGSLNQLEMNGGAVIYPVDNNGYNVFGTGCSGAKSWFVASDWYTGHGYWSFSGSNSNKYEINTYPNAFTGAVTGSARTIKTDQVAFNAIPTGSWQAEIASNPSSPSDIFKYSTGSGDKTFEGNCGGNAAMVIPRTSTTYNSAIGIPGGIYTGYSHFGIAGAPNTTAGNSLPVKLTYLAAEAVNNSFIKVSWQTLTEINNKGFEILRSENAVDFKNIGWADGHGSTTEIQEYAYNDKAVQSNQLYYYKLNQIDFDGTNQESYMVSAKITDGKQLVISDFIPNPTTGKTKLNVITSEPIAMQVKFYNILGAEVLNKNFQLVNGSNELNFDGEGLANATYTAVLNVGNDVYSKKLVITSN